MRSVCNNRLFVLDFFIVVFLRHFFLLYISDLKDAAFSSLYLLLMELLGPLCLLLPMLYYLICERID